MQPTAIKITEKEKAELLPIESPSTLGPRQVRGRTLTTLVSPGTELAANYLGELASFPTATGYAAVFEAEEIGAELEGIEEGDRLFCAGHHQSLQQHDVAEVVPVPDGLPEAEAVIARLMGVSMTTLRTTTARPGDLVLVTGLGPVGYLGAQLFLNSGYRVQGVEPDAERRRVGKDSGLEDVYPEVPVDDPDVHGEVALVLECSGHEEAVLGGARVARKRGEVVLVGVPWKCHTEIKVHDLVHVIFHNYVDVRSGWEWELPRHDTDLPPHSVFGGFRLALRWLGEGRIPLDGLIRIHDPANAQEVYQSLLHREAEGLFQVFDWTEISS